MKKLLLITWTWLAVLALAACNTLEGMGEDAEAVGDEVEESTDEMSDDDDDMF